MVVGGLLCQAHELPMQVLVGSNNSMKFCVVKDVEPSASGIQIVLSHLGNDIQALGCGELALLYYPKATVVQELPHWYPHDELLKLFGNFFYGICWLHGMGHGGAFQVTEPYLSTLK